MAEFQEVMRQWRRMCADGSIGYACAECKMYSSIDESICRGIPSEDDAKNIERFVMSWAAEHTEPVYPTWCEYLQEQGVLDVEYISAASSTTSTSKSYVQTVKTLAPFYRPIPADIAQKLGLQPKEG